MATRRTPTTTPITDTIEVSNYGRPHAKDQVVARRAALIDLLSDGNPHPREEIWSVIEEQLGKGCWGKRPIDTLARDLKVLRRNIDIDYSRRPDMVGYVLGWPPVKKKGEPAFVEPINWEYVESIRQLSVPEKNRRAFAMADFALRQKLLLVAQQYPDWPPEWVEREARYLVYGVKI